MKKWFEFEGVRLFMCLFSVRAESNIYKGKHYDYQKSLN